MAAIGPKIRFFVIFLKFGPLVFLEIAQEDSLEHCLTTSKGKTHGKNFGRPKLYPKLGFLPSFRVASLYFLDIAQDCRLGQCLTSNRINLQKHFVVEIGTEMIFSIVLSSSVHSNVFVFPRIYHILTHRLISEHQSFFKGP